MAPSECPYCHGLYNRIAQHFSVSVACGPQYKGAIEQRRTTAVLEISPNYKLGRIGENRPQYHFEDVEDREEAGGNDGDDDHMDSHDENYHEDMEAGTLESC